MKTKKILSVCVIFVTLFSLSSCSKEGQPVEDQSNVNPEDGIVFKDCDHQLVHFDAVAPTATKGGNIEYWYCENCQNYYSDAEGKNKIVTPYLRSLNRDAVQAVLAKYPVSFAWSSKYNEEPQTKGGVTAALQAVKAGVGIVSGALSATNSLKKLITNEGGKELGYFSQIINGVEQLQEDMNTVLLRTNAILNAINDQTTKNYLTKCNTRLSNIWEQTLIYIQSVDEYLELYENGEMAEEDVERQLKTTLVMWSKQTVSNGESYETMVSAVENMINDFLSTNVGDAGILSEPYTTTVRRHVQAYIAFDHIGYGDRANMIRYYQFSLAPAYYLWKLYRNNADPTKEAAYVTWKNLVQKCDNDFISMKELISADSLHMNQAYEKYRVFRPNLSTQDEVYYYKKKLTGPFDFGKWVSSHYWDTDAKKARAFFPPDDYNNKFTDYMEKMWNETTGIKDRSDLVIVDDFRRLMAEYPGISIYEIIKEYGDFEGAHLYEEKVNNNAYYQAFWTNRGTRISYSMRSYSDYEMVKEVSNYWNSLRMVSYNQSSSYFYGDFSIDFLTNSGDTALSEFYTGTPMYGRRGKSGSTYDNANHWGAIEGADSGGTKNNRCYVYLEHYRSEPYE